MGTRADFYVGRDSSAEWLGSIAWDGYPDGIAPRLLKATSEKTYRKRLDEFFAGRDDVTRPAQGWPWPWEDSRTTDYAYAFDAGKVYAACFGHGWFDPLQEQPEHDDGEQKLSTFPDMSSRKAVAFGKRSGVIVIGG